MSEHSHEFSIFVEDVVCMKSNQNSKKKSKNRKATSTIRHGVVQRVGNKDNAFSDEEDESSYDELCNDEVVVLWEDGEEETVQITELKVTDRSFVHGDIAARKSDPLGMSGTVVGVKIFCDLETSDHKVLRQINTEQLKRLHPYRNKIFATYRNWLCRIEGCLFDLVVRFRDDAKCILECMNARKLLEHGDYYEDNDPFYPSQILYFDTSSKKHLLRHATWVKGKYDPKIHKKGRVINVAPREITLDSVANDQLLSSIQLPESIRFNDIQPFQYYFPANWSVGDRGYYRYSAPSTSQKSIKSKYAVTTNLDPSTNRIAIVDMIPYTVTVKQTYTFIDILWQDGTKETNLSALDFIPVHHIADYAFWIEDFITEKRVNKGSIARENKYKRNQQLGIVQKVDWEQQTCIVKWIIENQSSSDHSSIQFDESKGPEERSIYDIEDHPRYQYSHGDIVLRRGKDSESEKEDDFAGEVIGIKDGYLEVIWSSGKISKIRYNEVISMYRLLDGNITIADIMDELLNAQNDVPRNPFRFNRRRRSSRLASNNSEQSTSSDSAEKDSQKNSFNADEDADWETVSEESSDEYSESTDDEDGQTAFNIPFPDIGKPNKIGYKKANEVSNYILDDEFSKQTMRKQSKESSVNDILRALLLSKVDSRLKIPKFDIVRSDIQRKEDHAFINEDEESELDQEFLKVMHTEWQRLINDLPDGIFVRTYESRIDLIRAVILGAPHTPYHNGVFVFDILLLPSYPEDPPSVHFISYNEDLSPNLAEDGEVSLNLLDSWHEDDSEGWDPENSSILELLTTIKESVLDISEPYFNEEGYKKQIGTREGIHKSRFYNENALLLSVNHMLNTLNSPPMHTEQIVARHFQEKKREICEELQAYLDNKDIVLKLFEYDVNGLKVNPSKGFQLRLQKPLPALKAKLEEKIEVQEDEQANCQIS